MTAAEQARQMIAAHELAAERNPGKREQHLRSAAYLRRQFDIPAPVSWGLETSQANRAYQLLETARIRAYTQRK